MPTEERCRSDEEGDPSVTRDRPTHRREEDPVDGSQLRWACRPLQHPKLMAEDEDLEVLASVVLALLATADEQTDESAGDEVEEGQHRPIVPGWYERESGFLSPTPKRSIEMPPTEDERPVERSAWALAFGARIGVWMTRIPSARSTVSNRPQNFASRSRMRNRMAGEWPSRFMVRFRACWVTHAELG
jgi:hypothetical protein